MEKMPFRDSEEIDNVQALLAAAATVTTSSTVVMAQISCSAKSAPTV